MTTFTPTCTEHSIQAGTRHQADGRIYALCENAGSHIVDLGPAMPGDDRDLTVDEADLDVTLRNMARELSKQRAEFYESTSTLVIEVPLRYPSVAVDGAMCFGMRLRRANVDKPRVALATPPRPTNPAEMMLDFLTARVAEDRAAAEACLPERERHPYGDKTLPPTPPEKLGEELDGYLGGPLGKNAARWHPLRVLADCAAKQEIIDYCRERLTDSGHRPTEYSYGCRTGLLITVAYLAAQHDTHPDYRQEWRP